MTAYTRTGGLMWDVPPDFKERIKYVADRTPGELDDIESILCSNPIWLSRMQGIGRITAEDVVDYGITGPNARASGVCRDLRRDQPYLGYEAMDFEIPTCAEGDCYARYIVRVEEMRQSARILQQAIRMLPDGGQVNVDPARKVTLPPKAEVHAKMEQMIHHFELIMPGSGGAPPVGEVYVANETAMGELGFYLVSDGTKFPYRVRVRPPSFLHYAMFPRLVEGRLLSDVVSVLSSLNIIAAELDR